MSTPESSIPKAPRGRRRPARDGMLVVALAVVLLVLFEGASVRHAGQEMQPGWERSVVLAAGRPAGWVADRLPFKQVGHDALAWLSPDQSLKGQHGFDQPVQAAAGQAGIQPVSPDSFDPAALGAKPAAPRKLRTLLVTGDSMAMGVDVELARRLAGKGGLRVLREPHIGTGVSKSGFVDWGKLSGAQVSKDHPDAVVVFIGANEGFDMPGPGGRRVHCCGPDWAALYADRVRRMMNTYRQDGGARVYWLTLPFPRESARQQVARAVNAAIEVASVPFRSQVRVIDLEPVFTPGGHYRDAMKVGGRDQIVRQPDGIHLNATGAQVAAPLVLDAVRRDFGG